MMKLASLEISILVMAALAAITSTAIASPELEEITPGVERLTPQERRTLQHYKASLEAYYEEKEAEAFKVRQMLADKQAEGFTLEQVEAELERRDRIEQERIKQQRIAEARAIERREAEERKELAFIIAAIVIALFVLGLVAWVAYLLISTLLAYRQTKLAEWRERREGRAYKNDLDDFGAKP